MNKNPTNVNIAIFLVEIHQASKANKTASKIDGMSASPSTDPSTIVSNMMAIPSNTELNVCNKPIDTIINPIGKRNSW